MGRKHRRKDEDSLLIQRIRSAAKSLGLPWYEESKEVLIGGEWKGGRSALDDIRKREARYREWERESGVDRPRQTELAKASRRSAEPAPMRGSEAYAASEEVAGMARKSPVPAFEGRTDD